MIIYNKYQKLKNHDLYVDLLLDWIGIYKEKKTLKILDLGTGLGYVYYSLRKKGFKKVYACDINKTFKQVDIFDFEGKFIYPNNFFDIVITMNTIEHIKGNMHFLSEIKRVLKKGGKIYILTCACEKQTIGTFYISFTHYQPYTRESLEEGMKLFFKDVKVKYYKIIPKLWRVGLFIPLKLKYNLLGYGIK